MAGFPQLRTERRGGAFLILLWLGCIILPNDSGRAAQTAMASSENIQFAEVAQEAGLTAIDVWGSSTKKTNILETSGNGVAFLDYDRDGWPDIYVGNGMRAEGSGGESESGGHLYHNNHDGTFTDVTQHAGLAHPGWQTGVCVGDYDNDGWDDLLLTYWGQNRLYRNNHDGTFSDVTERAGLKQSAVHWGTGCAFLDYDRDGFLDIFVANYLQYDPKTMLAPGAAPFCTWKGMPVLCGPRGLKDDSNTLYHNNRDGTFTDVSVPSGIARSQGKGFGAVSFDFDNDGWPDIYVANDSVPSLLFHNNHDGTFAEIGQRAGVAYNEDGLEQGGMGVAVGDYEADGWFDIFKANFSDELPNLYRNNRDGTFTDVASAAGLGSITDFVSWGAGFADFDNDGWKDLFYVNGHVYPEVDRYTPASPYREPRMLFRNLGDGRFENVSAKGGSVFAELFSSRGCAFGDFNNDGKMDVVIVNMNDAPSLWRNDTEDENGSILVKLIGTTSNRDGIGARVRVVTGVHAQMDEVHSGDSVMSASDLRLHFGVGSAKKIDLLEVRWPASGKTEQFHNLEINRIFTVEENRGITQTLPYFRLDNNPAARKHP